MEDIAMQSEVSLSQNTTAAPGPSLPIRPEKSDTTAPGADKPA